MSDEPKFNKGDRVTAEGRDDRGTITEVTANLVSIQWDDAATPTQCQAAFAAQTLTVVPPEEEAEATE